MSNSGTPLVELKDISIAFGGIKAVDRVSVDLHPGEVVGLLGHNGAGKSTLIKCLSGAYKADSGDVFINGEKVVINNPRDARAHNIETIYQTLALATVPNSWRRHNPLCKRSPAPAPTTSSHRNISPSFS